MTREHVQAELRRAIGTAVRAGARCRRRPGVGALMAGSADYAEMLVMPAVEAMVEEAVEEAVKTACAPYSAVGPCMNAPSIGSPLWFVWMAGSAAAMDELAVQLGVSPDGCEFDSDDMHEVIATEIARLLRAARQAQ